MLLRTLLWFIIGWLIYRFIRPYLPSGTPTNSTKTDSNAAKPARSIEKMVRCHVCELHVPQTEAIEAHGRYYCCEDHRRRDQQAS